METEERRFGAGAKGYARAGTHATRVCDSPYARSLSATGVVEDSCPRSRVCSQISPLNRSVTQSPRSISSVELVVLKRPFLAAWSEAGCVVSIPFCSGKPSKHSCLMVKDRSRSSFNPLLFGEAIEALGYVETIGCRQKFQSPSVRGSHRSKALSEGDLRQTFCFNPLLFGEAIEATARASGSERPFRFQSPSVRGSHRSN